MLVKCLVCGQSFRVLTNTHLETHGLTREQYKQEFPNAQLKGIISWQVVEKTCVDCGETFLSYSCATGQVRCKECQRKYRGRCRTEWRKRNYPRLREAILRRQRRYYKRVGKHRLRPITHEGDKSVDLTVVNGRVNGALWLLEEMKKKPRRARFFEWLDQHGNRIDEYGNRKGFYGGRFIVIDDDHTPYCSECGGKIVKAVANEHYSLMEYACSNCGVVLEA